ncbi:MAG TPA: family 20 glycosylhydrolase [Verrucomicrobiae bacterium]|jgi:hypothetical protein|nr:family 20 glycosylhydrolase [Verrucomicrobiae bacterium]
MKFAHAFCLLALLFAAGCQTKETASPRQEARAAWVNNWRATNPVWRGVHLMVSSDRSVNDLIEQMPRLQADGVNVIIAEVDYNFDFPSHPELRGSQYITRDGAQRLVQSAHDHGIRLIPQINCLGHQSWKTNRMALLAKYPQFEELPGPQETNKDFYCRSWCPQDPDVNKVVFQLIDDMVDAFDADAFHVGMDEVFIMASDYCPRCRGQDPAKLFAKCVNDLHSHIVGHDHIEMLMWADRLLDAKAEHYSMWEASANGTAPAIDMIPKDIIMCDWHYEKQKTYASVPVLLDHGFRVLPCGWQPLTNTLAFSAFSHEQREHNARVIGYLCSTWGKVKIPATGEWPPIVDALKEWK